MNELFKLPKICILSNLAKWYGNICHKWFLEIISPFYVQFSTIQWCFPVIIRKNIKKLLWLPSFAKDFYLLYCSFLKCEITVWSRVFDRFFSDEWQYPTHPQRLFQEFVWENIVTACSVKYSRKLCMLFDCTMILHYIWTKKKERKKTTTSALIIKLKLVHKKSQISM